MASLNWQKIREIFEECVDLPLEQQKELLESACGNNELMLNEVRKLLAGDDSAKSQFLEWPDDGRDAADDKMARDATQYRDNQQESGHSEQESPPTRISDSSSLLRNRQIGPYKLLQEIGHGGMGTVWLAQQSAPVNRRVAIKLIKSRLSGRTEIARFEAERQALALMNHPNIAKVFDSGTTEDGTPYYVMEFIDGLPVTEFCDNHKLSIRDRLQVFIPICRAIQHAHQKGVIHRDLKPSNILVAESEGFPVPIVIDFGLAKAIDHQRLLTDKTLFTEIGKVVGTLQYMSPEQAALNSNDIDSRTDIYSLGIILYELMTGMTPLDRQTIKDKAILKVLEIIRQSDTPRPSNRLSSSGDTITTVSEQRQIEPRKLQSILRGELDWVVMKALEKDRNRRYDSASSFADDIHRFLIDEPVAARPPSNTYRIGKFVARNRLLVASASIIGVMTMIGVGLLIYAYYQSEEKLEYANRLAEAETASLESLKELTDSVAEELTGANTVHMIAIDESKMDPFVNSRHDSATLLTRIGLYLRQTGADRNERKKWFYKGVQTFQSLEADSELEDSGLLSYATALNNASMEARDDGENSTAIQYAEKEIELLKRLMELEDYDKDFLLFRLATAYLNLAIITKSVEGDSHAIDYLLQLKEADSQSEILLAKCYSNRAQDRDLVDAESDMLRAIELFEKHNRTQELMTVYDYMSTVQNRLGKVEKEQNYRDKAIALVQKTTKAPSASQTELMTSAQTFYNAALALHQRNDLEGAIEKYDAAISIMTKLAVQNELTKSSLVYFQTFWNRGEAYIELGNMEAAKQDYEEAIVAANQSGKQEDLSCLPYLEARVLRCQAERDSVKAASSLEYVTQEIANKGETLIILASVFALAAEAEKDETKQQRWVDKAVEAIEAIKTSGKLAPQFMRELKESDDFEFLRQTSEFEKMLDDPSR